MIFSTLLVWHLSLCCTAKPASLIALSDGKTFNLSLCFNNFMSTNITNQWKWGLNRCLGNAQINTVFSSWGLSSSKNCSFIHYYSAVLKTSLWGALVPNEGSKSYSIAGKPGPTRGRPVRYWLPVPVRVKPWASLTSSSSIQARVKSAAYQSVPNSYEFIDGSDKSNNQHSNGSSRPFQG